MNNNLIWIAVAIFGSLTILAGASTNGSVPITYLSYVDNAYGFYKVLDVTTHKLSPYENRTLTINQGDTVTWINIPTDDSVPLTIISEQDLWPKSDRNLGAFRQEFSYKFDQPGKYTFHIQEYPDIRQIIIVNAIDHPVPTHTEPLIIIPTPTPIPTEVINLLEKTPKTGIPIKFSPTMVSSIIVAILAMFITFKWKK